MYEFEATLIRPEGVGTWTYLNVPFDVEAEFGTKSQVRVKGTVNGVPYRGSLMPHGNGTHYLVVKKEIRDAANAVPGDVVQVAMERDMDKREVEVPNDFLTELEANPEAQQNFNGMSYSHQKEYITWIESAKKPETRAGRITKSIEKLQEGKKLK